MSVERIPQKEPFLFVDHIQELEPGKRALGRREIRADEYFFAGHFPSRPVFPGVLMIEAAGQLANAVVRSVSGYEDCVLYYSKIGKARFQEELHPGDVMELEAEVKEQMGDLFIFQVYVRKESREAFRGEIVFNAVR